MLRGDAAEGIGVIVTLCNGCRRELSVATENGVMKIEMRLMHEDGDGLDTLHFCGQCWRAFKEWVSNMPRRVSA